MKLDIWVWIVADVLSTSLSIPDASAQFGRMGGAFGGARGGRGDRGTRGGDAQGNNRENRNERPVGAPDANSFEQIDYRLSLLQEDIKLTAEQSAAWQAFASKARSYAGDLARERTRGAAATPANPPPAKQRAATHRPGGRQCAEPLGRPRRSRNIGKGLVSDPEPLAKGFG